MVGLVQLAADSLQKILLLEAALQRTFPVLEEALLSLAEVVSVDFSLDLLEFLGETRSGVLAFVGHIRQGIVNHVASDGHLGLQSRSRLYRFFLSRPRLVESCHAL